MKVVCKTNSATAGGTYWLTVGRSYEILGEGSRNEYYLINDAGYDVYYEKKVFETIKETRRRKLNNIKNEISLCG